MQPQPLLRITGHVYGSRTIEVPARTDEAKGQTYDAYSYAEVSVLTVAGIDNAPVDGVTAFATVTDVVDGALARLTKGEAVDIYVRAYPTWKRSRGRSFPVSALRFCGPVATAAPSSRAAA